MAIKTYKKTDKAKLSDNFAITEFACKGDKCCSTVKIDEQLVTYLQQIRDHFGKPVTINSGYRCATHNKRVGGVTRSRHMKGQAADIGVKDIPPAEVAKYAESIGIKGVGLYETDQDGYFVHIDTRTNKSFWYGQAQKYRSTFGGATAKPYGGTFPTLPTRGYFREYDTGTQVKNLQKFLNWYDNYALKEDGIIGNLTLTAVRKFQQQEDLKPDGLFGSASLAKAKTIKK